MKKSRLIVVAALLAAAPAQPASARGDVPSAIGTENVLWLTTSPAYQKTGLVVAVSAQTEGCTTECIHLWTTHDGGFSWKRPKGAFAGGQPLVAVDSSGREVLFNTGTASLQRSDDDGETWVDVGPKGAPAFIPGSDAAVAVAGATDYILRGASIQNVSGSGGAMTDTSFALAPGFPNSGPYPPALLVGIDKQGERITIQQCTADLSCHGATTLLGTATFKAPLILFFSSDYAKDGVVFAQAPKIIYKSSDGGVTFNPLELVDNAASTTTTPMMTLAPSYREAGPVRMAYVSMFQQFLFTLPNGGQTSYSGGGVYRTTDGGATWGKVGSPGPFEQGAIAVASAADGRLFAGYIYKGAMAEAKRGGLLCSSDGGKTWHAACRPHGASAGAGSESAAVGTLPSVKLYEPPATKPKTFWKKAMAVLGALALVALAAAFARDRMIKAKAVAAGEQTEKE